MSDCVKFRWPDPFFEGRIWIRFFSQRSNLDSVFFGGRILIRFFSRRSDPDPFFFSQVGSRSVFFLVGRSQIRFFSMVGCLRCSMGEGCFNLQGWTKYTIITRQRYYKYKYSSTLIKNVFFKVRGRPPDQNELKITSIIFISYLANKSRMYQKVFNIQITDTWYLYQMV